MENQEPKTKPDSAASALSAVLDIMRLIKLVQWISFFAMVLAFSALGIAIYKVTHREAANQTWQEQQAQCIERLSQRLEIESASLGFALQQEGVELSRRGELRPLGLSNSVCGR